MYAFQREVTRVKRARLDFEASGTWYRSITRVRLARDIGRRRRAIISASTTGELAIPISDGGSPHM